jgi:hypothetical protein
VAIPAAQSFRDGRIYRVNVTGEVNGGGGTSTGMGIRYGLGAGMNAETYGASGVGEARADGLVVCVGTGLRWVRGSGRVGSG